MYSSTTLYYDVSCGASARLHLLAEAGFENPEYLGASSIREGGTCAAQRKFRHLLSLPTLLSIVELLLPILQGSNMGRQPVAQKMLQGWEVKG